MLKKQYLAIIMNILARNIELTDSLTSFAITSLDFVDKFSKKESKLFLVSKNKNEIDFMFTFDIEGKSCIIKIKDTDLKSGIKKIKRKAYQKTTSITRCMTHSETIRKMHPDNILHDTQKTDSKTVYVELKTLDKPMSEDDAKKIMIEKRLHDVMFINIDSEYCLSIMCREKNAFKICLTNIQY